MSYLAGIQATNFWPAVLLAVLFPICLLGLSEAAGACRRAGKPIARTLAAFRNLVVPSLALFVFLRFVLELPADGAVVRVVASVFWVLLLYALLGVINDLVFAPRGPQSWGERVPKLFRDLARALLVALGALAIYSLVWGHDVSGALTALGLGSIVIGLALQEPLGNIVSGVMLLFERPLSVGDWVTAEGVTGRVVEINWRSVHIETATRELHVIPNVSLYKAAFSNLSRPTPLRTEVYEIGFSYDDPPNRVKSAMGEMLASVPGVLRDPPPAVRTSGYADFSVTYKLIFSVASQKDVPVVRDEVLSRLWYAARRAGLTIPFPIRMEYRPGENPGAAQPTPADWLAEHPRFAAALGGGRARTVEYAEGEMILGPGHGFDGFALIVKGRAALLAPDKTGQLLPIGEAGAGECFGDQVTAGASADGLVIRAAEDLVAVVFDSSAAGELLQRSPGLAAEIGEAVESRRRAASAARGRPVGGA